MSKPNPISQLAREYRDNEKEITRLQKRQEVLGKFLKDAENLLGAVINIGRKTRTDKGKPKGKRDLLPGSLGQRIMRALEDGEPAHVNDFAKKVTGEENPDSSHVKSINTTASLLAREGKLQWISKGVYKSNFPRPKMTGQSSKHPILGNSRASIGADTHVVQAKGGRDN